MVTIIVPHSDGLQIVIGVSREQSARTNDGSHWYPSVTPYGYANSNQRKLRTKFKISMSLPQKPFTQWVPLGSIDISFLKNVMLNYNSICSNFCKCAFLPRLKSQVCSWLTPITISCAGEFYELGKIYKRFCRFTARSLFICYAGGILYILPNPAFVLCLEQ